MNVEAMKTALRLRLEDKGFSISPLFLVETLELAQQELAVMLGNDYLTELETSEDVDITSSKVALSSLNYQPLKGGNSIINIKMANGLYAHQIDVSDMKQTEISHLRGTDSTPQFYIFAGVIYFLCDTAAQTVTVFYHKKPMPITPVFYMATASTLVNGTPTPSSEDDYYNKKAIYNIDKKTYHIVSDYTGATRTVVGLPAITSFEAGDRVIFVDDEIKVSQSTYVNTDLNHDYDDIILLLAEGDVWKKDGSNDRSNTALTKAYKRIANINKGDQ